MKSIYIVLLSVVMVTTTNAQQIEWVKRMYGSANSLATAAYPTSNGFVSTISFLAAAQLFDNPVVFKPDSSTNNTEYTLIAFVGSEGEVMGTQFVVNVGLIRAIALNDSECVCLIPNNNLYINGELKLDSGQYEYGYRLVKFNQRGHVSLLHDFPLLPGGASPHKMIISDDKQKMLVLFSQVQVFDTLLMDTAIVKRGQGLIAELNTQNGQLLRLVNCPPLFNQICYSPQSSHLLLGGSVTEVPYTYTLNGITYTRTNEDVKDVVMASFNMDSGTFDWHKVIHVKLPNTDPVFNMVTLAGNTYASFRFMDTLTVDGQTYGTVIPFNTIRYNTLIRFTPDSGLTNWVRILKGVGFDCTLHAPYHSNYNGVSVRLDAESDISMDGSPLPKMVSRGANYMRLTPDGILAQSFNYTIVSRNSVFGSMSIPVKVNEGDSTVMVIEPLLKDNPLVVKGQTYQYRNMGLGYSDFLAIRFKSTPTSNPTGVTEWYSASPSQLVLYPNPCTDIVYLNGLGTENIKQVEVFDITGKLLLSEKEHILESINVQSLSQGLYFVKISTGESVHSTRLVKQ